MKKIWRSTGECKRRLKRWYERQGRVIEKWTLCIAQNFKGNNKILWMGINEVRNSIGEELSSENNIESRWKEYFVQLLNGDELSEVGFERMKE